MIIIKKLKGCKASSRFLYRPDLIALRAITPHTQHNDKACKRELSIQLPSSLNGLRPRRFSGIALQWKIGNKIDYLKYLSDLILIPTR